MPPTKAMVSRIALKIAASTGLITLRQLRVSDFYQSWCKITAIVSLANFTGAREAPFEVRGQRGARRAPGPPELLSLKDALRFAMYYVGYIRGNVIQIYLH